jgi:hypothetical protein
VRVELAGVSIDGDAVDMSDEGHLLVREDTGAVHAVAAGDVVHLRAR